MDYLRLTLRLEPGEEDEGGFVAFADPLGIASQGESVDEAIANIKEAVEEFIEATYELDDLHAVLKARGVEIYNEPPDQPDYVKVAPGELVSALVATVGKNAAFI